MIRIGILGASSIAPKSIIFPAKNISKIKVQAIASREINRAINFAKKYEIPIAYGNYNELLNDKNIDAVYISLANHLHKDWIIAAAKAKKHILVEKPVCLGLNEWKDISSTIEKEGVHILEGIMVDHHPWIRYLQDIVKSNKYGLLRKTETHICYQLSKDESYRFNNRFGGGVFWDESFLWSHLLQRIGVLETLNIYAKLQFDIPNGVDIEFSAKVEMVNGLYSEAIFSYQRPFEFTHWLFFDNMVLKLRNFIRPLFAKVPVIIEIYNHSGYYKQVKIAYEDFFQNQLEYFCDVIIGNKVNKPFLEIRDRVEFQEKVYNTAIVNNKL